MEEITWLHTRRRLRRHLRTAVIRFIILPFWPTGKGGRSENDMKDARTMAYINLFAVLGALPYLCELDREAAKLIAGKTVSVGFAVKDGPSATLFFGGGKCRMAPGVDRCQVKLPFSSCEKFNGLIDGTVTPIRRINGLLQPPAAEAFGLPLALSVALAAVGGAYWAGCFGSRKRNPDKWPGIFVMQIKKLDSTEMWSPAFFTILKAALGETPTRCGWTRPLPPMNWLIPWCSSCRSVPTAARSAHRA